MADTRTVERGSRDPARRQIRGSSLLLSGRSISLGAKLLAQMLMVRYLSTADYGSWAYALSVVALLGGFASLGLDRAVSRFASIYHEREEHGRLFGTLLLATGAILVMGVVFTAGLYLFPEQLQRLTGDGNESIGLLYILIFLVPTEALDQLLIAVLATFHKPRAIFVRRYVLAPVVQVGVVLLLILQGAGVVFLAWGYLAGTLLGVALSAAILVRVLREEGLLPHLRVGRIRIPAREIFSFTVPLMTSDWLSALIQSSGALLLGYFYDTEQIAFFRVVVPIAVLNQVVMRSFTLLYIPGASRMFAERDFRGINDLYWKTAIWIAILSFPIFAVTLTVSTPLTVLLFGARYAESGTILAILAVGSYMHAMLGFNGTTLKVLGRVGYVVVINTLAAVANVALTLLLVPPFGAVGAAIAMSASYIVHNILKQVGLRLATGFSLVDTRYSTPYLVIAGGAATLVGIRVLGWTNPFLLVGAAAGASLAVLWLTKRTLQVEEVFPELLRVPVLRAILT